MKGIKYAGLMLWHDIFDFKLEQLFGEEVWAECVSMNGMAQGGTIGEETWKSRGNKPLPDFGILMFVEDGQGRFL